MTYNVRGLKMLSMIAKTLGMLALRKSKNSRKGGVLVEYIVLVSVIALSALILAAVTGLSGEIAQEYTEMGSEVNSL